MSDNIYRGTIEPLPANIDDMLIYKLNLILKRLDSIERKLDEGQQKDSSG